MSYLIIQGPVKASQWSDHGKSVKTTEEVALQILLLCQFGVGTVANVFLFVHNFSPVLTDSRLRPIQVILINLAVANAFMLLLFAYSYDMIDFVPRKPDEVGWIDYSTPRTYMQVVW